MTNKQISTYLNNAILPNMLGENTAPVAEDLSNYVELGTKLASLTADTLKDFKKRLAVQISNDVIARTLEKKYFKMYKTRERYQGALQRIVASNLLQTQDSHIINLVNGQSYIDGKYYGVNIDSVLYTDVDTFKVPYSISDDDWALFFTSIDDMKRVMGIIYNAEETTITSYLNALQKRLYMAVIENCHDNNRKVQLLTTFNSKTGGKYTMEQIYADRKLFAYFSDFVKSIVEKLQNYIADINKRYNDGTVTTFTPKENIELVMISDFISDIKNLGNPVDFSIPALNTDEVTCWQTTTDAMLPTLQEVSTIKLAGDKTINNVIGMIYDIDSIGITTFLDKVTSEYVGAEGFTNYFHHMANNYFYDTRFGSVILTLD